MRVSRIIITGLIASGKTQVIKILENKGYNVISADNINRKLLEKGNINYNALKNDIVFKKFFVGENLDKKLLAKEIFKDPKKINRINSITHTNIYNAIEDTISKLKEPLVFIEIPLFFQTNCPIDYDYVWVVDCPKSLKAERLMKRDNISLKEALNRISVQQKTLKEKKIDVILDNSKDHKHLEEQIELILNEMEKK